MGGGGVQLWAPPPPTNPLLMLNFIFFPDKVRNIKIDPVKKRFSPGEIINCTAEGNPAPTVKWAPMKTARPHFPGAELMVTTEMVGENSWKCEATNTPKDLPQRIEKTIDFTVGKSDCIAWHWFGLLGHNASVTVRAISRCGLVC